MTTFLRTSLLAITVLWSLGAAAMFGNASARAQDACIDRDDAVEQLSKQYGEKVAARGLTQNGKAMFELLVSKSGSWTVLVSDPAGRSCIVANGEDWQRLPAIIGDPV